MLRTIEMTLNEQASVWVWGAMGETASLDLSWTPVVCVDLKYIGISDSHATMSDHIGHLVHYSFGFFLK